MSQKVALMEFEGNANIGLFFFVNDKFALLGKNVDKDKKKEIENVLNVPVYEVQVLGTDLLGVFTTGNNEFILVPEMYEHELKKIKEICNKHEIKVITIEDKLNTLGNNICVGKEDLILNFNYSNYFIKHIEKVTGLKAIKLEHKEFSSAGAVCLFAKDKYYVSQELNEEVVKEFVEKIAGVGSINSGAPFISSGIVCNNNGILIGSQSSTVEIQEVVENLNYL